MTQSPAVGDFLTLADPYRGELLAHCYRMLGSIHDAEDLVQETYLRAWRSYGGFEGRSSLRTWLYRIATRACLTALDGRRRRPLPIGLGSPDADPGDELVSRPEVPWLEPVPDASVRAYDVDPAAVVTSRASLRLAVVAALQHLPPRQRAVLILRDVLSWRSSEVADLFGTTTAAVNSALQRARAHIERVAPDEDSVVEPTIAGEREVLDRYAAAFERKDIASIVELLTADVVWEMPPFVEWYRGRDRVARHLDLRCPGVPGGIRLVETRANGQPAFGMYLRADDATYARFNLQVLTLSAVGISGVVSFFDLRLFPTFGLPESLPADAAIAALPTVEARR
jgi:RNA polymerase sigma-70 factor (ECF subfamily)